MGFSINQLVSATLDLGLLGIVPLGSQGPIEIRAAAGLGALLLQRIRGENNRFVINAGEVLVTQQRASGG